MAESGQEIIETSKELQATENATAATGSESSKQIWQTEEQRTDALIQWSHSVRKEKGDFPKARLTPEFLKFVRSSNYQYLHKDEEKENSEEDLAIRLDGSASLGSDSLISPQGESCSSNSSTSASSFLLQKYPSAVEMLRMAPAKEALKHHVFLTERRRVANQVKLGQKLGLSNPLPPLDPEKVMPFSGFPGWDDDDVQGEVGDWREMGSGLLYQAILFKNQSDLRQLRDNRDLLEDSKFYLLKPCVKDMAL